MDRERVLSSSGWAKPEATRKHREPKICEYGLRTEISPQIHKTMAEYFILRTLMLALKLWSHKSPKQFHISILLFTEKKKKKSLCLSEVEKPREHGHLYLNQARMKCRNNRIKLFCGLALFSSMLCGRNPQCWNTVNAVNVVIILLSRATTGKKRIALRFIVYAADQKIQLLLSINYFNQVLEKQKWKCSFNPSRFKGVALSLV